jgi:hypothetical protein
MKREFLFIAEQMLPLLDDKRVEIAAPNEMKTRIRHNKPKARNIANRSKRMDILSRWLSTGRIVLG